MRRCCTRQPPGVTHWPGGTVGSGGIQGPEAITSRSLPSTSESTSTSRLPAVQARANPPPLTRLNRLRAALSVAISAPDSESWRVTAIFSSSEMPDFGAASSADPPPVIRAIARSSGSSDPSMLSISRVASTTAGVGRFAADGLVSRTSMALSMRPQPAGTLTSPVTRDRSRPVVPSSASTPAAKPAAAFPAPITTIRPMVSSGSRWGTSRSGSTALIAAVQIAAAS